MISRRVDETIELLRKLIQYTIERKRFRLDDNYQRPTEF